MNFFSGLLIVVLAGVLQGSFFLPMTYTKKWQWAHSWFAFSLLAMLLVNWGIALLTINGITSIIAAVPVQLLLLVGVFGLLWGIGAILFGKAMDMLGMALGYPIIMGINAITGTLVPALVFSSSIFLEPKGLLILLGALVSVVGIYYCARASSQKDKSSKLSNYTTTGLILAVISGFTSCLPNLGAAFSQDITRIAVEHGVGQAMAGNVIWSLFFTAGSLVNMGYCLFVLIKGKELKAFINEHKTMNWGLILGMSAMWIGSFYAYGYGAVVLGDLGLVVGWPLLVSLSIVIGNLWGIFRGEWTGAPHKARKTLNFGIVLLIGAVLIIALNNLV
ncbi:L-rhamnose/proton symporter RhaT [uncultured Sunxiuqinia sp.]|uniref:L-rhamnose/proton symporter RhaT n=1 Tax=uncultured Sunxiuqinia sp. TaxID=1573825 RepID=UPI002619C312|nr:L-rhamnose/proton symporter RhaT [uncultured Sunxiuqinia sp.]